MIRALWTFVGSRPKLLATGVLVVGSIILYMIQSIQSDERDKIQMELERQELDTRKKVEDAVRNSPSDVESATQWLLNREPKYQ